MMSKVLLALCLTVAVAVSVPAQAAPGFGPPAWVAGGGVNPGIPPWVRSAPWFPQWITCTTPGASCLDCNTKAVCFSIGGMGIKKACSDPTMPYCNLGECSATPTPECAPAAVPATTA